MRSYVCVDLTYRRLISPRIIFINNFLPYNLTLKPLTTPPFTTSPAFGVFVSFEAHVNFVICPEEWFFCLYNQTGNRTRAPETQGGHSSVQPKRCLLASRVTTESLMSSNTLFLSYVYYVCILTPLFLGFKMYTSRLVRILTALLVFNDIFTHFYVY